MSESEERLGQTDEPPAKRGSGRGVRSGLTADPRQMSEREASEREQTLDAELTDEVRLELFRDLLHQSVLPDLPQMPGFHVCWLTTSNPRDSIQLRKRLGYELIRVADVPGGWDGVEVRAGDYAGVVGINEMVAARIPLRLYHAYLREAHHLAPLAEEEKLRASLDEFKDSVARRGSYVQEGDGTANLVQRARQMQLPDH
jgi:hypothetical protein